MVRRRLSIVFALLLAVPLLGTGGAPAAEAADGPSIPTTVGPDGRLIRADSVVVKFRDGGSEVVGAASLQASGLHVAETVADRSTVRVQVRPGAVQEAITQLRGRPGVEWAEPDYILSKTVTLNDPYLPQQWGPAKMGAPTAWNTTSSTAAIKVAVLDCGIFSASSTRLAPDGKRGHPDLRTKVVAEQNFTPTSNTDDLCGHGSHVAGIAAAAANNGAGIVGVAYGASIMNGKVLDNSGSGATTWIASGIRWAADNGAKVINMSLGADGPCSSTLQSAIDYAWSKGVVIVAAAGNSNRPSASMPANCNHALAVASTNSSDARSSFSNYGSNVQVAAPGEGILSLSNSGGYVSYSGTSMASPHVAGLAALVWATRYGTNNQAVVDRIRSTADRIAGTGTYWTSGRVNAAAAVAGGLTTPTQTTADLAVTQTGSTATTRLSSYYTYSLTVTNNGPLAATGVTLTDTLPSNASYYLLQTSQGSCTRNGATVSCNLGTLNSGARATVAIIVRVTGSGTLVNTANVVATQPDPNANNNRATLSTPVQ